MLAALLIACGALAHAGWNIAVKRAGARGPHFLTAALILSVLLLAPLGLPALIDTAAVTPWWPVWVTASAVIHTGYFLLLQRGYARADVGVVYPLARGTGPVISVLGAILLLGERPAGVALLGGTLIVAGVMVISSSGAVPMEADARRRWRGVRYGLAVGILIAGYTLWDAAAVTQVGLDPLGYFWAGMVAQSLLLAALSSRRPRAVWEAAVRHRGAVLLVAVLSPLAYLSILYAYQLAPVSIVAPAREVSVVLIAIVGWLVFREPHPVRRIVGSVIVLIGVALLAAS